MIDQAVRAGDLESRSAAAWSRCRRRRTCCPARARASAWATSRRSTRWSRTACATPFTGKQMFEEATEIGDELEMTRADLDKWALRSHERAIAATDEGRLAEEIVPVTITRPQGRHRRRGRRGAAPRLDARVAGQAAGPERQGRQPHRRQLAGRQRRRGRARAGLARNGPSATARRSWPRSSRRRRSRTSSPGSPARPPTRPRRRSTRPACSRTTSTCGRSTRPSPRSR